MWRTYEEVPTRQWSCSSSLRRGWRRRRRSGPWRLLFNQCSLRRFSFPLHRLSPLPFPTPLPLPLPTKLFFILSNPSLPRHHTPRPTPNNHPTGSRHLRRRRTPLMTSLRLYPTLRTRQIPRGRGQLLSMSVPVSMVNSCR